MEGDTAMEQVGKVGLAPGKCKICRGKAVDVFFGIPSCKTCRGIFKRGLKKKFECVAEVEGICDVKKTAPLQCKACIYAKCVRKGMVAKEPSGTSSATKPKPKKQEKLKKQEKEPNVTMGAEETAAEKKSAKSIAMQPERFYQVEADLKSLFHHEESTKPFSFFDSAAAEVEDEFSLPIDFGAKNFSVQTDGFYDEAEERDVVSQSTINRPWTNAPFQNTPQREDTFFFTEDDPRIEKGLRYFSMTKEELEESIEIWKKIRPQLAADFKKIKKQANRKRKTFER
ncbi:hypothetical protein RvY_03551 [Ramazzottius varieornatus]|uniref:Nuclear receptor domain-containing protein n=1 Tax=Ramazzottius varieornatus TaxID=947166 RepID=A0A1D1UP94_RAMVA|nr:hypothetical protein RvY_03551 [Ramazzottius varieornatus]